MHILFLSQLVPYPPDSGAKVRIYYTLRYLTQFHEVTLLTFTRTVDNPVSIDHLRTFCKEVHTSPMQRSRLRDALAMIKSIITNRSFIIERDRVTDMIEAIEGLIAKNTYDAIHADQIYMVQYALYASRVKGNGSKLKLVVDKHNTDFLIFKRMAAGERNPLKKLLLEREWRALRRFEGSTLGEFDQIVTVTRDDREMLVDLAREAVLSKNHARGSASIFTTIPICVDTSGINPANPTSTAKDILYIGGLHWPPNVEGVLWFARQVWPIVKEALPEATFTIAGKNPPAEVQALEANSQQPSGGDGQGPTIRVTGYVPDPQPYLEAAGVFIVPLFAGSGMRVKIVDAWRWGLPIVSTTIGAEGIEYIEGENILIADNPQEFGEAVVRVLKDRALNQALRVNGRRWVEQKYDWQKVYAEWDQIYPR